MRILSLILIVVCAKFGFAQTFNKTFLDQKEPFYFQTIASIDSIIITAGFGIDSSSPNKPKYLWKQLNSNGELLQEFAYKDSLNGLNGTQNGLYVADSTIYHCLFSSGDGYFSRPIILKTNFKGEVFDEKFYSKTSKTVHSPLGFFISSSNHIYIYGLHQPFGNESNAMVIKVDKDLNQIWFKDFGVSNRTETAYSILELTSGNLLIGAHRTDPGGTVAGQRYKEQTWIFEIDTAGNMVREFLDTNTRTGPAKGLTQSASGGYVYCGKYQTGFDGHLSYNWGGSITKIDNKLQNKVWEKIVTDTSSNAVSLESILKVGNRYIAIGNNIGYTETNVFNEIVSGYFISFNENGNKIYDRYYSGKDSSDQYYRHYLYSITKDKLNSIIAVGQVDPSQTQTQGWIIKLDSLGCLASTNCGNPGLFVQESKELFYEFDIYPNPVKETLFINTQENIEHLKIYNTLGEKVVEQRFPPNQVNLSALISGLYFMNLKTAKGVFTKKFVKE